MVLRLILIVSGIHSMISWSWMHMELSHSHKVPSAFHIGFIVNLSNVTVPRESICDVESLLLHGIVLPACLQVLQHPVIFFVVESRYVLDEVTNHGKHVSDHPTCRSISRELIKECIVLQLIGGLSLRDRVKLARHECTRLKQ
jgi:hypothetical protein